MFHLHSFDLRPAASRRSISPAEILAREEALLDFCEASAHPGFLSFWEADRYFVVIGYGKKLSAEVYQDTCNELKIPILRRTSGGGTVLQGPGCLNYSLVCPIDASPEFESISATNRFVMEKMRLALAPRIQGEVLVQGHTDLTVDGLKFSGNAQRRKRRCLLFHGSILIDFDLGLISRTLQSPQQQPEYRQSRPHSEFITNLRVDRATVTNAIKRAWDVNASADKSVEEEVAARSTILFREKYSQREWNERF